MQEKNKVSWLRAFTPLIPIRMTRGYQIIEIDIYYREAKTDKKNVVSESMNSDNGCISSIIQ